MARSPATPAPDGSVSVNVNGAKAAVVRVDQFATTLPTGFADTADSDPNEELERARASIAGRTDAEVKPPHVETSLGGWKPPPVATQELVSVPSPVAPPQVSPKAASHVVPVGPARTAAMRQSAQPLAPHVPLHGPAVAAAAQAAPQASFPSASPNAMPTQPRMTPVPLSVGGPVTVLWANGQRYRGIVVQFVGTRVLVAFPDGKQHWVEMAYVSAS